MALDPEKRFQKLMNELFHVSRTQPSSHVTSSSVVAHCLKDGSLRAPVITSNNGQSSNITTYGNNGCWWSRVPQESHAPLCRPWDRGDLMRRLATFKSMTWFAKPKAVSPLNCARRGWVNVDLDTISCEACGVCLLFSTHPSWTQQQVEKAAAVFSLKLDNGHKQLCPWIHNVCDETLALFPPTPAAILIDGYKGRYAALLKLSALPTILPSAIEYMWDSKLQWFLEEYSSPIYPFYVADDHVVSCRTEELSDGVPTTNLYYQAQKLISLCGWEPHLLPYIVDCKDQEAPSNKDVNLIQLDQNIITYLSSGTNEVSDTKSSALFSECQLDPAAVTLNCQFCGASVGLWAFSTILQPLELIRLVEFPLVNDKLESSRNSEHVHSGQTNHSTLSIEKPCFLNLSIAGGPSPTKQSPRPTISLPIISRHLRSTFSSKAILGKLKRKRSEDKLATYGELNQADGTSENEKNADRRDNGSTCNIVGDNLAENNLMLQQGMAANSEFTSKGRKDGLASDGQENGSIKLVTEHADGICRSGQVYAGDAAMPSQENILKYRMSSVDSHHPNLSSGGVQSGCQMHESCDERCENWAGFETRATHLSGGTMSFLRGEESMQFDPIKQHRHFCPWIVMEDSPQLPGWQVTLTALFKEYFHTHKAFQPDPMKVDNPVISVRKLLLSPAERRNIH